jgi:cytoskeleton protein RodZ
MSVMPLDLGGVTVLRFPGGANGAAQSPSLDFGSDIGVALKAAREFRGLSLEDISNATRVRQVYLAAIEDMRLEELPSRPFVIGYLRAYARSIGVDEEAVIARFREAHGEAPEPLREPIGLRQQGDPRLAAAALAGVIIIAAIATWNVARRAMNEDDANPAVSAATLAPAAATPSSTLAQVSLGEPLPAPVESTTPEPYITPGLADAAAAGGSADAVAAAIKVRAAAGIEAAPADGPPPRPVFEARGTVYGLNSPGAAVLLQARRPASLVVSGSDGRVYFARQLAAGESYRAPVQQGLSAEVSDPSAFAVYVNSALTGVLPGPRTALAKLAPPPAPPPPATPPQ